MKIVRPAFPSPVICIDEFLPEDDARAVLQECFDLKKVYMPAKVFDGPSHTKIDLEYRNNEVVYLDDVYRSAPERSDILRILKSRIWTEECRRLWHEGDYIFDIINYSTWQEAVLSWYGNGAFYKKHQDTRRDHITYRIVSLVYYVNKTPTQFSGGNLVIWYDDEALRLEPCHNRAIVFPSFSFHEVENTFLSTDNWEDGRFSLNYWIGFR
jgi:SM-20-related protein